MEKKKYLVEFIKQVGRPCFERVTELTPEGKVTAVSGWCSNFYEIPNVKRLTEKQDSFKGNFEGVFSVKYEWQNFRSKWFECDEQKYNYLKGLGKTVRIILEYIA